MYNVFIPTRGRIGNQLTYDLFSKRFLRNNIVSLVCSKEEKHKHQKLGYKVIVCPVKGISKKRQWIMEYAKENKIKRLIMIDDDFDKWAIRKSNESYHLRSASNKEVEMIISKLHELNKRYAIAGISSRSGNNRFFPNKIVECVRQSGIYAIRVNTFFKIGAQFDRLQLMEDFDVVLTFLENGYKNAILADCVFDYTINTSGGCSSYRTSELQKESAEKLKSLHPNFVTIITKKTKSGWKGLEERTDVRIQWRKAYASSRSAKCNSN